MPVPTYAILSEPSFEGVLFPSAVVVGVSRSVVDVFVVGDERVTVDVIVVASTRGVAVPLEDDKDEEEAVAVDDEADRLVEGLTSKGRAEVVVPC